MSKFNGSILGQTVALTLCPAEDDCGGQHRISGLFDVEEFLPYEPSNYVHESGYHVFRAGEGETPCYFVKYEDLWEQVDPQSTGRQLELERWLEQRAEDLDREEAA